MKSISNNIEVIRLLRIDNNDLIKAFADISINDSFIIKGLKVLKGPNGLFIDMPSDKTSKGKYFSRIQIISKEFKELLQLIILEAYEA